MNQVFGPFAPLLSPQVRHAGLMSGLYQEGAEGLEQRCAKCGEYWPADTEFFHSAPRRRAGLHPYCKACITEYKKALAQRK